MAIPSVEELMSQSCDVDGSPSTVHSAVKELALRTAAARNSAVDLLPDGVAEADSQAAETWLLRFVVSRSGSSAPPSISLSSLEEEVLASLEWRASAQGRPIVDAAREGYTKAISGEKPWNNEPVLAAAPHSAEIRPFFTPAKLLTMRNANNDGLIYVIRAGQVNDKSLMSKVDADELADFFLYAKAVNERVAARLSANTGKLSSVVTVNDLSGVDLFGDSRFRDALSAASKTADSIFPGLAAETILLNLPFLVRTLVKVFTPLFPPSVQKKLKFSAFDIAPPEVLVDQASSGRAAFIADVNKALAS